MPSDRIPKSDHPDATPDPVIAAGVLVLTRQSPPQFLLMRHASRWDLPKGHADPGETPLQAATRELAEETGLPVDSVQLDPDFQFVLNYPVRYKQDQPVREKQVHYFLGWIDRPRPIACTEHLGCEWVAWDPPHQIQTQTIDPLLAAVDKHLRTSKRGS
jgi:8-oxo-dGTP pyrophosphatase MutT (NUDIX family)